MGAEKLIFTGPSTNGIHGSLSFAACPRKWAFYEARKQEQVQNQHARGKGSLLHLVLAHHYKAQYQAEQGLDPHEYAGPMEALEQAAELWGLPQHVPDIYGAFLSYKNKWGSNDANYFRVMAVEQELQVNIPGVGIKTIRVDLILKRTTTGAIYFVDHKSTSRFSQQAWAYSRDLQFLFMEYVGRLLGVKWGGLILNLVEVVEPYRCVRPHLEIHEARVASVPMTLRWIDRLRALFQGLPPEEVPAIPSEATCQGRYARCDYAATCDSTYSSPALPATLNSLLDG